MVTMADCHEPPARAEASFERSRRVSPGATDVAKPGRATRVAITNQRDLERAQR
jgi:hypothetical protein